MAIKAVLFDIDGTLIDSNDLHVEAWDEAFREAGYVFDRKRLHGQIGKGGDNYVPALLPDLDGHAQKALSDAHDRIFKSKYLAQAKPFPRARDLIAHVHGQGQRVVLASSASRTELDHYVDLLDARDLLFATTSKDDVESSKPAPDIFASALKKAGPLERDEVLAVGDTPYDIESAAKSGIGTVAVRSGKFPDADLRGAVALYDDVAAILAGYDASPLRAG